ncbi:MAG: efflux RND transporter periplasmic adaptor subunit [Phycisphaerae bacterium]
MNETTHSASSALSGSTSTSRAETRRLKLLISAAVILVVIAAVAAAILLWNPVSSGDVDLGLAARVRRGSLPITVRDKGTVEPEKKLVISNELDWSVIIKWVAEEGTRVEEGEKIIEFECKELIDTLNQQELRVTAAQNDYTRAQQHLELTRKDMENRTAKARQKLKDAKANLQRYLNGEYPVKLAKAEGRVALAERDLELAREKLEFKERVNENPELDTPYSEREIKADKLQVQRNELSLTESKKDLEMLTDYDHPAKVRELEMAISDAELELEKTRMEAKTQILSAESDEQSKRATLEMQTTRLEEYNEARGNLVITAEKAGLVVYDVGWRGERQGITVGVGEKISPRQQLLVIPEMDTLQVETRVMEAIADQVQRGTKAYIQLDSRSDETYTGEVTRVAPLPSGDRWMNPNVKFFDVTVKFDELPEGLRPNMTTDVELELAFLEDVLTVPVAAVFSGQDRMYCYVVQRGSVDRREVKLGRMNEEKAEVFSGLSEGDMVLMTPPTESDSDEREDRREDQPAPDGPPPMLEEPA